MAVSKASSNNSRWTTLKIITTVVGVTGLIATVISITVGSYQWIDSSYISEAELKTELKEQEARIHQEMAPVINEVKRLSKRYYDFKIEELREKIKALEKKKFNSGLSIFEDQILQSSKDSLEDYIRKKNKIQNIQNDYY